jgi:AraC family transcriptional regulator of arabinose operon
MNEPLITLNILGVDFRHDRDFLIDRPRGSGDYLFLHFPTPIELRDGSGTRWREPNSCILYSPGYPQWYRNGTAGFVNNWFHFSADGFTEKDWPIPLNKVFHPGYVHFIPRAIGEMRDELLRRERHWRELMDLSVRKFFLETSRATVPIRGGRMSKHEQAMYHKLLDLKVLIGREFRKKWTIGDMAARIPLSVSRFSVLYKKYFKVSPVEDLLSLRIEKARWMLERMPYSVSRIGEECGFDNVHYFSRLFKLRTGCSPSRYNAARQKRSPLE